MFNVFFWIVIFFFKLVFFLIGMAIAIPILFALSGIVFGITGGIILAICLMLDKHTTLIEKSLEKIDEWIGSTVVWWSKFRRVEDEGSDKDN